MKREKNRAPEPITTTATGTYTYPSGSHYAPEADVICPFKGNCSDEGMFCCPKCKNNTGKKSHYNPDTTPYWPPHPPYHQRPRYWY